MGPSVLIVGAGSVGQVFGRHLQLGGAAVTFFVRERHREETARGFDLYPLREWKAGPPIHWDTFEVVSRVEEVRAHRFDQVWLAISSAGLPGPWLPELVRAIGDATVVTLQPGPEDRALILASGVPPERLVAGLIGFLSYSAPLEGEVRIPQPGTAYWLPPLVQIPFSGPRELCRAVVEPLVRGRMRASIHRDVPREVTFSSAILNPLIAALEQAGWSLRTLTHGPLLGLAAEGIREALAIVARIHGSPPVPARLASSRAVLRTFAPVAPSLFPVPLEAYLRKHFTKVGAQTRLTTAALISDGERSGLPVGALQKLAAGLGSSPRSG